MNNKSLIENFVKLTDVERASTEQYALANGYSVEEGLNNRLAQKVERVIATWRKQCSPEFDETDMSRLNQKKLNIVLDADMSNGIGLYLHGKAGVGKTRLAFVKLAQQFSMGVTGFIYMTPFDFVQFSNTTIYRADEGRELMDKLSNCGILFIDDVFKDVLSKAQEMFLFSVLSKRKEWKRPVIMTSNVNYDDIPMYFADDGKNTKSDALMRRIGEMCQIVKC